MKLKLGKYAFGVFVGKIIKFMVFQRGIEANPEKVRTIIKMQPPRNTKEVQQLAIRVTTLSRFIS